jgi:anthranilate synthase/aminodeoxychorismate synthase-like glutamine amidotransferase
MVLLIDNYDSFTYILCDYIRQCGQQCAVIRNDEKSLDDIQPLNFDSIVISAGPKTPQTAGITMQVIEHFYRSKPILGICLGHQAIGVYFGMSLKKADLPMHGKTSEIEVNTSHFIFKNLLPCQTVMRYHSLILEDEKNEFLDVIARTKSGEVMAVAHKHLPVAGLQFHPESVLTKNGLNMLKNWFDQIT